MVVQFPDGTDHTFVTDIHQEHAIRLAEEWNLGGLHLEWVAVIFPDGTVFAEPRVADEGEVRRMNYKTMKPPQVFLNRLLEIAGIPVNMPTGQLKEPIKPYFPENAQQDPPLPLRYGFASIVTIYRKLLASKLLMFQ